MDPDGTLSSSDLAGMLFPAVPGGIPFPVGPVGPFETLSTSDSGSVGPVGPGGTLSSSDLAGTLFPAVPAGIPFPVGPIGPVGTLSPSDSDSVGPVGPYGTLSPSRPLSYPARAGIPNYKEGANTRSRTRPETSASPNPASTRVIGTLRTRFSVNLSKYRTLPDAANLPPGLYCSADDACRTGPPANRTLPMCYSPVP